jgi:hypothetical protein
MDMKACESLRFLASWAPRLRKETVLTNDGCAILQRLISAAASYGAQARRDFGMAVEQSSKVLSPLGEPLIAMDFTIHRWVAGHREEAFSDWLAWIFSQAKPKDVLRILGVDDPKLPASSLGSYVEVQREIFVAEGHEGSTGRLDLKVRLGPAVIVVEIKLTDAETADTVKNAGYKRSAKADKYILLINEAEENDYWKFQPRRWADTCRELRCLAARFCKDRDLLKAAMVLAFVAAVEQRLLGYRRLGANTPIADAVILPSVTDHLEKFVESAQHVQSTRE